MLNCELVQFGYVWLNVCLINTFFKPAIQLLKSRPRVKYLEDQFQAFLWKLLRCEYCRYTRRVNTTSEFLQVAQEPLLESSDNHEEDTVEPQSTGIHKTSTYSIAMVQRLASDFNNLLMCTVFGLLVPQLLILLPLCFWLNLSCLVWVARQHQGISFDEAVAMTILVNPPVRIFERLIYLGNLLVAIVIFWDMQFGAGPIVFYCVVNVATSALARSGWARKFFYGQPKAYGSMSWVDNNGSTVQMNQVHDRVATDGFIKRVQPARKPVHSVAVKAEGTTNVGCHDSDLVEI